MATTTQEPEENRKINRTLLGTGVGLILLTLAFGFFYNAPNDIQIYLIVLCASLGVGLIVSQINGIFKINLPLGITATGAIGVMVMVFYFGRDLILKRAPKEDESFKSVNVDCNYPKVKFAIFCSANTDYNRNILISFINSLEQRLPTGNKQCVYYITKWGSGLPFDSANVKDTYMKQMKDLYFKEDFDYFVSIGTQASVIMNEYLRKENILNEKKFLFLGVTDPVAAGIVKYTEGRKEDLNVGGVAYCGNYDEYPIKISELYPGKKLCYIYNKKNPQDEHLASRFQSSQLKKDGILEINSLDHTPTDNDVSDSSKVYFSWVTFENMFGTESIEILKKINYLVTSTSSQVEQGWVPFAVTTSDDEIGRQGAELVSKVELNKAELGKSDIIFPKWKIYVNVRLARDKKISNNIIKKADFKYDEHTE